MLWRVRNSRGRPINAPAAFIHPCQPIVAKQPPSGPGWVHELKHDGYRLQIHVRSEVVCLVKKGIPDFDMLHGRTADHLAVAYDASRFVSAS